MVIASAAALIFLPHPIPKTAIPVQRLYLGQCAGCHGANGRGSWRATLFLMRPGNLADPQTLAGKSDEYLLQLIKHGGATIGKPGMPAFGYYLSDAQIRDLIDYIRALPRHPRPPARRLTRRGLAGAGKIRYHRGRSRTRTRRIDA